MHTSPRSYRFLRLIGLYAVLSLAALTLAGCWVSTPSVPPGITGSITTLDRTDTGATILVEGGKQPEGAVSDKATVAITDETSIIGPDTKPLELDDLAEGDKVRVWFAGAVAESYPVQGMAAVVQKVR